MEVETLQVAGATGMTVWVRLSDGAAADGLIEALRAHTRLDIRAMNSQGESPRPHDVLIVHPGDAWSATANPPARPMQPVVCRGGLAPHALSRIKREIEDRLSQNVSLSELAQLAGLSACHFARAFKQSVGTPPHRYLLQRRLVFAAALIRETDRPLTEIALASGFSDQSHFTRSFVRHHSETPSAFRRRHR